MEKSKDWWLEKAKKFFIPDNVSSPCGWFGGTCDCVIEKRDKNEWAVCRVGYTLSKSLEWEYESTVQYRTKQYLKNNRYGSKEEALEYLEKYFQEESGRVKNEKNAK